MSTFLFVTFTPKIMSMVMNLMVACKLHQSVVCWNIARTLSKSNRRTTKRSIGFIFDSLDSTFSGYYHVERCSRARSSFIFFEYDVHIVWRYPCSLTLKLWKPGRPLELQ
jgi:hypothetical protein